MSSHSSVVCESEFDSERKGDCNLVSSTCDIINFFLSLLSLKFCKKGGSLCGDNSPSTDKITCCSSILPVVFVIQKLSQQFRVLNHDFRHAIFDFLQDLDRHLLSARLSVAVLRHACRFRSSLSDMSVIHTFISFATSWLGNGGVFSMCSGISFLDFFCWISSMQHVSFYDLRKHVCESFPRSIVTMLQILASFAMSSRDPVYGVEIIPCMHQIQNFKGVDAGRVRALLMRS